MNAPPPATLGVEVTDHALVRYMERVGNIDLSSVRAEIAEKTCRAVAMGAGSVRHGKTTFILQGNRVVTVLIGRYDRERRP